MTKLYKEGTEGVTGSHLGGVPFSTVFSSFCVLDGRFTQGFMTASRLSIEWTL